MHHFELVQKHLCKQVRVLSRILSLGEKILEVMVGGGPVGIYRVQSSRGLGACPPQNFFKILSLLRVVLGLPINVIARHSETVLRSYQLWYYRQILTLLSHDFGGKLECLGGTSPPQ